MDLGKEQWQKITSILLSAVLAILAVLGWVITPVPIEIPEPQVVVVSSADVGEGDIGDGDIAVDLEDLDFGATSYTSISVEDVTTSDDVTVNDDLTVSGMTLVSFADLTVTDGYTLTPAYNIYALDSAGAVTITLAAAGTEGQLLILIGDDANDVTIADTNLRSNDGAAQVLNAYDVLMLVYQDSEWVEISESNDS